jgi:2,3-bisphosphoglycerate-independent phosphoglycerate mutase
MTPKHPGPGGLALAEAVHTLYRKGQSDYVLEPIVLTDDRGQPVGRIADGDGVVFCCRRGEREVQLTEAFVDQAWDRFPRRPLRDLTFVILTLYHEKFKHLPVAFAPTRITDTLGEVLSRTGLTQLRVAESEKFSHVTFFFNGGREEPFAGENDICVPSPRGQPFDRVPELSLAGVTQAIRQGIQERFDFIVANIANGDVIGHTSSREAKLRCVGAVDARLGEIVEAAFDGEYAVLVTADHGNLEVMTNPDGSPHVSHTDNPVPFLYLEGRKPPGVHVHNGTLADVGPTALRLLGLEPPGEMDGACLLPSVRWLGGRRVLLLILDGWGLGRQDDTNPIFLAQPEVWGKLTREHPTSQLLAAGGAVGLRPGKAGNSEAGHMNLGAGRLVLQDDVRLDLAMKDGSFSENETLCRVIREVRKRKSALHLIGLLSERSSHGTIDYPLEVLRMARRRGLSRVYLHLIFDGRSTEPGSAPDLLAKLEEQMREIGVGRIATGIGRGIALDRDGDYAKTRCAYEALVDGVGVTYSVSG